MVSSWETLITGIRKHPDVETEEGATEQSYLVEQPRINPIQRPALACGVGGGQEGELTVAGERRRWPARGAGKQAAVAGLIGARPLGTRGRSRVTGGRWEIAGLGRGRKKRLVAERIRFRPQSCPLLTLRDIVELPVVLSHLSELLTLRPCRVRHQWRLAMWG